jgi:hypothetical protein
MEVARLDWHVPTLPVGAVEGSSSVAGTC